MKKTKLLLTVLSSSITFIGLSQPFYEHEITKNNGAIIATISADINNDGNKDIVAAALSGNKISWYENLGAGTFSTQKIISSAILDPSSVYGADIDGDGNIDIIASSSVNNEVVWYKNLSNGNFSAQKLISNQVSNPSKVFASDINNDGKIDVLSASESDSKIAWYENLGNGTFSTQKVISLSANGASSIYTDDMDSDGDLDVLSTSKNDNKVAWYKNLGNGTFSTTQYIISSSLTSPEGVASEDMDGDGDKDIIAIGGNIVWYENLGGNSFSTENILGINVSGKNINVADMDNDGVKDIVAGSQHSLYARVMWYKNLGGGNFSSENIINNYTDKISWTATDDFDNDGKLDIVAAAVGRGKIIWFKNLGGGNFSGQTSICWGARGATSVYAADLDGDGDLDALSASFVDDKVAWYENLGNGNFSSTQNILCSNCNSAQSVYAADLDNDGDMDVLSTSASDDQILWYENLGSSTFSSKKIISSLVNQPYDVIAKDIDGDGYLDVISASIGDDRVAWFKNLGNGYFGSMNSLTTNSRQASSVYASDLDNDGDLDIMCASMNDHKLVWFENLGNSSFSSEKILSQTSGDYCRGISSTDLDNDGDMDILFANQGLNNNVIGWIENLGNGNFSIQKNISNSAQWAYWVDYGDIDNDGDMDVFSASELDNKIAMYENLGNGLFGPQQVISNRAAGAQEVITDDIDNDGDIDVLSASYIDDKIAWYENLNNSTSCNAINLAVNNTCNYYYTANTLSKGSSSHTCQANSGSEVWFKFTAPNSGEVLIQTKAGFLQNGIMSLYSNNCSSLNLIACNDNFNNDLMPQIQESGLISGNVYYIKLSGYNSSEGSFGICISEPSSSTSISDYNNALEYSVYPNPTNDVININFKNNEEKEILIFDNFGKIIAFKNLTNTKQVINLSKYSKGMYYIKVSSSKGSVIKKIILN